MTATTAPRMHLIGIGGAGMSALAEVLHAQGMRVSGSDRAASPMLNRLEAMGIHVQVGHEPNLIRDADEAIYSSAVAADNPERLYARDNGIACLRRAEAYGRLLRGRCGIAVAGTHGKTTTTALLGHILTVAGLDPTVLVGGTVRGLGHNARVGRGNLVVTEADEYDQSFLSMVPHTAIITNVDADHLECYGSLPSLHDAFRRFAAAIPAPGLVVACSDDAGVRTVLAGVRRRIVTYGLGADAHLRAEEVRPDGGSTRFRLHRGTDELGDVILGLSGRHNVRNALAATAAAFEHGAGVEAVRDALRSFAGVERRFQNVGAVGSAVLIDDYAHHPTEIAATLAAARDAGYARILAVFQPHLYSRTRDLRDEFAAALLPVERAIVTPIYAAREAPLPSISGADIVESMRQAGHRQTVYATFLADAADCVRNLCCGMDAVILLGAGDITDLGPQLGGKPQPRSL